MRFGWTGCLAATLLAATPSGQSGRYGLAGPVRPAGPVLVAPANGGPWTSYPTIQDGVDAAAGGDSVLLSAGIFKGPGNRDVHVAGKNLRIEYRGDSARCVIDAEGAGIGFFFDGIGVTSETLLRGVTIVNGQGVRGGGIRCESGATPRIEHCAVRQCRAGLGGGIFYVVDFAITPAMGSITDCLIQGNFSTSGGGGIIMGQVDVERSLILDNTSNFIGVGVSVGGAFGSIRNSVIARNRTSSLSPPAGGGVSVQAFQFQIESCTIAYNKGGAGGGVAFWNIDPTATMSNTIVWGNEAVFTGPQVWHHAPFGQSVATIRHCDIEGGQAGIVVLGAPPNVSSIFDLDPEFLDGSLGDVRLSPSSPLIELGDPALPIRVNEGDFQREPRRLGMLDLGADEVYPPPAMTLPAPGRAGEMNAWTVRGAAPGALVLFLAGGEPGSPLPFELCPNVLLGIQIPSVLGLRRGPSVGDTTLRALVPARLAGDRLLFQAIVFDPALGACQSTPLVPFEFP